MWTIQSHVPRRMAMVAYHLPCLARSPNSALALIAATQSLKSLWNRSLLLLSQIRRRLILLPLSTNTHVSDALCVIYFSFNGQGCPDHRVSSSYVCRRMMCLNPWRLLVLPRPTVTLVRAVVAVTTLSYKMMATAASIASIKACGSNTGGG